MDDCGKQKHHQTASIESMMQQTIKVQNLSQQPSQTSSTIDDLLQIKTSRSPTELGLYRAFLTKESQIVLDSKLLSQLWKICIEQQTAKVCNVSTNRLFEGFLEMKVDYTGSHNQMIKIEEFSSLTENQYVKKTEGSKIVKYQTQYTCIKVEEGSSQNKLCPKDLAQASKDLFQRVNNVSGELQFYQATLAKQAILDGETQKLSQSQKLYFDTETQHMTPFDFMRLLLTISADQLTHRLIVSSHLLYPAITFQFQKTSSLRFYVSPLSRILLNKFSDEDSQIQSNFDQKGVYTGFIALDEKNRVVPLMPNDPATYLKQVSGVWIYGLDTYQSPYVWSACTRFALTTNFKEGNSHKLPLPLKSNQTQFLLVLIDKSHKTQFMTFKLKEGSFTSPESSLRWNILEQSQAIDREVNLYFKPFIMKDMFKTMIPMRIEGTKERENSKAKSSNIENGLKLAPQSHRQENEIRGRQQQLLGLSNFGSGSGGKTANFQSFEEMKTCSIEDLDIPKPQQLSMIPHQIKNAQSQPNLQQNRSAVNRSRNSLSQNRLQQQQLLEVKQEPNESQTEDDEDMVKLLDNSDNFHGTPRSRKLYMNQKTQINNLEALVKDLQEQVTKLNEVIANQQRQINENQQIGQQRFNYSGQTTAYQTKSPNSRYDSNNNPGISPHFQTGTFNQPQPFHTILTPNSGNAYSDQHNYGQPNNPLNNQSSITQAFDQLVTYGQDRQIPGLMDITSPDFPNNQSNSQNLFNLSDEQLISNIEVPPQLLSQPTGKFVSSPSTQEQFDSTLYQKPQSPSFSGNHEEQQIPIPESKQIGDKRSRNKGKSSAVVPPLKIHNQLNTFDEGESSKKKQAQEILTENFNEIAQSQTMSEVSNSLMGGGSSNHLKRSQSSAFETTQGLQELKAMKSDLKQQYEEQIVSHRRPKGSRNVLNNNVVVPPGVNQNIMAMQLNKKQEDSSSSENSNPRIIEDYSSDDEKAPSRGDIDHTYNPYSFKKLEQAIFKKPPSMQQQQFDFPIQKPVKSKMIVVETMECVNQQYKCGQTDWTMDLPKFNFLPPEDEEEEEETDNYEYRGNHINIEDDDDDDEGYSQPNQEIINIEDIQIKQEQQQKKLKPKKNLVLSDDDDDDEMAEIERKYLGLIK